MLAGARKRITESGLRNISLLQADAQVHHFEPGRFDLRRTGDSVDVVLITRDDWTTQPEFAIESAGGESFLGVALIEQNILGWGKGASLAYRETPEGITRSAAYSDPNVFGSRMRLAAQGGTGTEGASQGFEVGVPFYAEESSYAYGVRWSRATSVAHLFQAGDEAATFDRRIEETEIDWGRGWKRPPEVVRLTGSFLVQDRRLGASRLEPGAPAEFGGGEENLRLRRLGLEARWWRPGFREWQGVDRLGGVEDIDLGPSMRLGLGLSPRWLGGTSDEGFTSLRLEGGTTTMARSFALVRADLTSRWARDPLELVGRLRARWIDQFTPHHTLVLAAYGAAGHRTARDFQEILGGLKGLRASTVRALAGQEAWRFNAEHRWWMGHDFLQVLSLGAVGFYDLGRTFGPGAVESRWRQDAGVGLRIALPRSGQDRVARVDVAWPIARGPGEERGPVLSIGSGQAF